MRRARKLTASGRVLLAMAIVLGIVVVLFILVEFAATTTSLLDRVDRSLEREAFAYAAAVHDGHEPDIKVATQEYLRGRTVTVPDVDAIISVRFPDGTVFTNTPSGAVPAPGPAEAPKEARLSNVEIQGEPYREIETPVVSPDGLTVSFSAALPIEELRALSFRVTLVLVALAAVGLAVGLPFAYAASRASLAPLTRMAHDVAEIDHAALGRRLEYDGPHDELGTLTTSLNAMLGRIEESYSRQKDFIADASHELRTPIAVIRGNAELILSGNTDAEETIPSVMAIEAEAIRIGKILDDMLLLARLDRVMEPQFQALDGGTLLSEVAARTRTLGVQEVVLSVQPDLWIEGDPDMLEAALINLTRNATMHAHKGGRITLTATGDSDTVSFSVVDDGPGIPADEVSRIFDRFYRAKRETHWTSDAPGAGLGLAITKRIVDLHGGSVAASNVEPHGACFLIKLKRIPVPASPESEIDDPEDGGLA